MNRHQYYETLKKEARELRCQYGFETPKVGKADLRKIFRNENIRIDLAPSSKCQFHFKEMKGAYFPASDGCPATALINKKLPDAPRIFTMAHELKHHFFDQDIELCLEARSDVIEIGAEVFGAELLFPDELFIQLSEELNLDPPFHDEDIVRLKQETQATMSYAGLVKKAERLKFAEKGSLRSRGWIALHESIYGANPWRKRARRRGSLTSRGFTH